MQNLNWQRDEVADPAIADLGAAWFNPLLSNFTGSAAAPVIPCILIPAAAIAPFDHGQISDSTTD